MDGVVVIELGEVEIVVDFGCISHNIVVVLLALAVVVLLIVVKVLVH